MEENIAISTKDVNEENNAEVENKGIRYIFLPKPFTKKDVAFLIFRILSILLVIIGIIFCSVFLSKQSIFLPVFTWIQDHKVAGAFLSLLGYIFWIIFAQTHSVLDLIMGVIFGIGIGLVIGMIGTFIGSMSAFFIGRFTLQKWIRNLLAKNRKIQILSQSLKNGRNGFQMTIIARLSLPSQLVNYGICVTEVRILPFACGSFVGMSPWVIQFVILGSSIRDLVAAIQGDYTVPKYQTILVIVFSIILIIGAIVAIIFARRKWKRLNIESEDGVELP